MTYATLADLTTRFKEAEIVQLCDPDNRGRIDEDIANQALADADEEINSRIAGQYELPLPSVPALLVRIACDIARYRLYDDNPIEEARVRYEDAVRDLKAIGAGDMKLIFDNPALAAEAPAKFRHGQGESKFDWGGYGS